MRLIKSVMIGLLLSLAAPLAAFAQCSGQAPANTYCGNPTGALALPGWKPMSGFATDIDVGSTTITGGGSGRLLYDNSGVLGEVSSPTTARQVLQSTVGAAPIWDPSIFLGPVTSGIPTKATGEFWWDNTGNYTERNAAFNISMDTGAAAPPAMTFAEFTYVQSRGDNTTFTGGSGKYIVVADRPGVTGATKGAMYGLLVDVRTNVARNNVPFDDAAGIVIANTGTAKATAAIEVATGSVGSTEWGTGIGIISSADRGLHIGGTFGIGIDFTQSVIGTDAIRLPNAKPIVGINVAGTGTLPIAEITSSNFLSLFGGNVVVGSGSTTVSGTLIATTSLRMNGSTSGTTTLVSAATAGASVITFPAGTTNFSATGGANQVVKQTSAGGAFTVATLSASDIVSGVIPPNIGGSGVANNAASTFTISGAFPLSVTVSASTSVTLPTSGTLAALGGTNSWTATNTFASGTTNIINTADANIGATLNLRHVSASPALNDYVGFVSYQGNDSAGNTTNYGQMRVAIIDPTDGSEDGTYEFYSIIAGTEARRFVIGAGVYTSGMMDQGVGTMNAASYYANNTAGLSVTKTVRASGGAADCTLIYTGGILTGGSC